MRPKQPFMFVLTLAVIAAGSTTGVLAPRNVDYLPRCFRSPVLAIELPRDASEIATILGSDDSRRRALQRATYADFLFIVSYVCLWFALVCRVSYTLGSLALLAGIADVLENIGILRATAFGSAPTQAIANWTRYPSLSKWALLGVVFLGLLYCFWPKDEPRSGWQVLSLVIGLGYGYAGLLCIAGVLFDNLLIEQSTLPLSVAIILQLVMYAFAPVSASSSGH